MICEADRPRARIGRSRGRGAGHGRIGSSAGRSAPIVRRPRRGASWVTELKNHFSKAADLGSLHGCKNHTPGWTRQIWPSDEDACQIGVDIGRFGVRCAGFCAVLVRTAQIALVWGVGFDSRRLHWNRRTSLRDNSLRIPRTRVLNPRPSVRPCANTIILEIPYRIAVHAAV